MVTDQQVVLLKQKLMEGKSQQAAAAASGMSVRTARTWQRGRLPSERKGKRRWRTRPDPFAEIWAEEVEPLLRSDVEGALKATTILEWLDERRPGCQGRPPPEGRSGRSGVALGRTAAALGGSGRG